MLPPPAPTVKVYCNAVYYPNWKVYDQKPPSVLRTDVISHIFYAFAWVKPTGEIYLSDEWADTQIEVDGVRGCLRACARLKQQHRHLKVILSVGGGGHSEHFASVATDPSKRSLFASSARALVDQYGIDGIDIDWEHPSNRAEGQSYIGLLYTLRQYLPSPLYTLTSALPAGQWALQHIPLAEASQYLDHINLMAYDFAGPWTQTSGHHAQLHCPPSNPDSASGATGVHYVLSQRVAPYKLLLGIPCYARSFLGTTGPGQRHAGGGGQEGTFEFASLPSPGGSSEVIDEQAVAAHCITEEGGWLTYDNPRTVGMKAAFVRERGLGGLFYWHGVGDLLGALAGKGLVVAGYEGLHVGG